MCYMKHRMIFKILNSTDGTGHQVVRMGISEVFGGQTLTPYFLEHAELRDPGEG